MPTVCTREELAASRRPWQWSHGIAHIPNWLYKLFQTGTARVLNGLRLHWALPCQSETQLRSLRSLCSLPQAHHELTRKKGHLALGGQGWANRDGMAFGARQPPSTSSSGCNLAEASAWGLPMAPQAMLSTEVQGSHKWHMVTNPADLSSLAATPQNK